MRTKLKKNGLAVGLAALLMFSVAGHAWGTGTLREINVFLNSGISILLHGERFVATEPSTGTELLPITYNGNTYLPLRAVAEATGLEVEWDGRTQTVYLGNSDGSVAEAGEQVVQLTTEYGKPAEKYRTASATPHLLNRGPDRTFEYGYSSDKDYQQVLQLYIDNDFEFETFRATIWMDDELNDAGDYISSSPRIEVRNEREEVIYSVPDVEHKNYYDIEVDISKAETVRVIVDGVYSVIGDPVLVK